MKIGSDLWNAFVKEGNAYHKPYCSSCVQLAGEVVSKMFDRTVAQIRLKNADFDWDEYAKDTTDPLVKGDILNKQKAAKKEIEKSETELQIARDHYDKAKCDLL